MCRRTGLIFLMLFTLEFLDLTQAEEEARDIGDLSDTLKSVVYSLNRIENKLERHEVRERALGELLKKGLQALQRGQRSIETPLQSFELRLSQIELLLKKPEVNSDTPGSLYNRRLLLAPRYSMASAYPEMLPERRIVKEGEDNKIEISEQLTQISANIEILLDTSRNLIAQTACKQQLESTEQVSPSIVEKEGAGETNIREEIMKISTNVENLLDTFNLIVQKASFSRDPLPTINDEFENKLLMKFDELATGVQELRVQDKIQKEYTLANADRELIYGLTNDTLSAIENTKAIVQANINQVHSEMATLMEKYAEVQRLDVNTILRNIDRQGHWLGEIFEIVNTNHENPDKSVEIFNKSRTEPQSNTENGHYIQLNDLLDKQSEEIVNKLLMILKSLDNSFNLTQTEAMRNLNSTIKNEISYIWRQISITNGDITNSAELLRQMRGRSEVFVNSVLQSLVSIGDKVEDIKGRMADVHTNQDYLLDNLSLLSQKLDAVKEKLSDTQE